MSFFLRCFGVFAVIWIIAFFIILSFWSGPHGVSGSFLFAGVLSIILAVFYGSVDELWLQHRQY